MAKVSRVADTRQAIHQHYLEQLRALIADHRKDVPGGEWDGVPVVTEKDLLAIVEDVFQSLPPLIETTGEVAAPLATVTVQAHCPRCQQQATILLTIDVEERTDAQGTSLHLKGKSKPAAHVCGQIKLPEKAKDEPEQAEAFGLEDIIGPVPTAADLLAALEPVAGGIERELPTLEEIEGWNDLQKREAMAWAKALAEPPGSVEIPRLPEVLGGTEPEEDETEDEEEPEKRENCPFPGCTLEAEHSGDHDVPPETASGDDKVVPFPS